MIERFIRQDSDSLPHYGAVQSLETLATRYGFAVSDLIRLDSNENPYGPSPLARAALSEVIAERYPDSLARQLRGALAEYSGVTPEQVIVGNGGDEIIDLIFRLFLDPGDEVIDFPPTFGVYATTARLNRGRLLEVWRGPDYAIDVEAVRQRVGPRTKLMVICNPNNPTGNLTPRQDLLELLDLGVPAMVDEAYLEFAGTTVVDLLPAYPNLLIARTMSKWSALAGLRIGYGLMSPALAERVNGIKAAFNVNAAAEAAAIASLADRSYLMENVARLREDSLTLQAALRTLPFLDVEPSVTNFIYCLTRGVTAEYLYEALLRRGIVVRLYTSPPAIRISVGTPEQNAALLAALMDIGSSVAEAGDTSHAR